MSISAVTRPRTAPVIVEWNNGVTAAKYAYIQNLQGDIVGIVDSSGTEVVKYTYDAWRKVLSTTGSLAATLGTVQPFRYRGYVYDVETGLYYLRSRYYNPDWNRFVNADKIIKECLFVYCQNNPTNAVDPLGCSSTEPHESIYSYVPSLTLNINEYLDDNGYYQITDYYLVEWREKRFSLTQEEAFSYELKLKTADLLLNEIPSRIFDKIVSEIINYVFPPSAMAKEVIDMYDEFSDAKTLYNYMFVWVEPGDYRKIVALYKYTINA